MPDTCHFCNQPAGMHSASCPIHPARMANGAPSVPLIGQRQQKLVPGNWTCPTCGYRAAAIEGHPEQEDQYILETVMMVVKPDTERDGKVEQEPHCPKCWARFVARATPRMVLQKPAREDASATTDG